VVGSDVTEADLADDWKAVHEMTHLALPDVDETHLWLAEGIAVYVEPCPRAGRRSDGGKNLGRYGAGHASGLAEER
jgi:hypothetical protein